MDSVIIKLSRLLSDIKFNAQYFIDHRTIINPVSLHLNLIDAHFLFPPDVICPHQGFRDEIVAGDDSVY